MNMLLRTLCTFKSKIQIVCTSQSPKSLITKLCSGQKHFLLFIVVFKSFEKNIPARSK